MSDVDEDYSDNFGSGSESKSVRNASKSSFSRSRRSRSSGVEEEDEDNYSEEGFEPEEQDHTATMDATLESGPPGARVVHDLSQLPGAGGAAARRPQPSQSSRSSASGGSLSGRSRRGGVAGSAAQSVASQSSRSAAAPPRPVLMDISQLGLVRAEDFSPGQTSRRSSRSEHRSPRSKGSSAADPPVMRCMDISQLPRLANLQESDARRSGSASRASRASGDRRGDAASHHRSPTPSRHSAASSSRRSGGDAAESPPGDPRGKIMNVADLLANLRQQTEAHEDERSPVMQPPATAAGGAAAQIPSSTEVWRAPEVPRHPKPHAWDLASLGQEEASRLASASALTAAGYPAAAASRCGGAQGVAPPAVHAQLPLGRGLRPVGGGGRGFGGTSGSLGAGTEAAVVDNLAQRFVLDRKAPSLERRERAAYQEMLRQVAWTALEPTAAQEAALLLGKRWLAPVSSTETLRAFRRCLHSILTDERVLDIVEHQMTLHFSRTAGGTN